MAKQRFENQPHYALHGGGAEIFDTRFPRGQAVVPDDLQAYEFSTEQLELPIEPLPNSHSLPHRIQGRDYVNGLTALRSTGRDGEDASGGIQLLEVIVPGEKVIAAIHSYLGFHDNGMPAPGTSWVCEFEDVPTALEFWDKHWKPSFHHNDLEHELDRFVGDHDLNGDADTLIRSYEAGILRPWFQQRTTDAVIGGSFASDGIHPVRLGDRDVTAEGYTPGNVYKIPETDWHSTNVKGFRTATCLAALRQKSRRGMWMWDPPKEETVVQWDDGQLTTFRIDQAPELLPTPLTVKDIQSSSRRGTVTGIAS